MFWPVVGMRLVVACASVKPLPLLSFQLLTAFAVCAIVVASLASYHAARFVICVGVNDIAGAASGVTVRFEI